MEFTINLLPNQQCIHFIDRVMEAYMFTYNLPYEKEICFVVHELIINSVEAMEGAQIDETETIEITVSYKDEELVISVIDKAGGIPENDWDEVVQYDLENFEFSDRGRGLFFVRNMVDSLLFKYVSETKFLVQVSKKIAL